MLYDKRVASDRYGVHTRDHLYMMGRKGGRDFMGEQGAGHI